MSFDDILLHIQGYPDETPPAAIEAALAVAKGLAGRISALAVELSVAHRPHLLLDRMLGMEGLAAESEQRSAAACREGVEHFRGRAAAADLLNDVDIVSADMGLEALRRAQAARAYDFSIYALTASGVDKVLAETLMLLSGRPLLILPEGHGGVLDRVMVAWDGGAVAAKALNDALPVLRTARSVTVATVAGDKPVDQIAPVAHALRHLRRHGVLAEAMEIEPQGRSAAVALEHALRADRADLLVMGAFGHSRLQEIVLGGVTEHMISHTPTAVWLSH